MFTFGQLTPSDPDKIIRESLTQDYDRFKRLNENYKKMQKEHSDRMIDLDLKFKKESVSLTRDRSAYLKRIPKFWATCLQKHEDTKLYLIDEQVTEFLEKHLVDIEVIFTTDERFGLENKIKYGKEGICLKFEFSPNEYFENNYLVKALGKKREFDVPPPRTGTAPSSDGDANPINANIQAAAPDTIDYIGFCESVTPIKWKDDSKKKILLESPSLSDSESLNGEEVDKEFSLSFFSWILLNTHEKDSDYDIDEEGCDKFSKAIVDDLWNDPMEWFTNEDEDDDSDSSSEDDEFEPEEDMD